MSAAELNPGPHPSHDWVPLEELYEPTGPRQFCSRCEICTCHSPDASSEACEFAPAVLGVPAKEKQ